MFKVYDDDFCFVSNVSLHWIQTYAQKYGVCYKIIGSNVFLVR